MKKLFSFTAICLFLLAVLVNPAKGQIIFSEDFDGVGGPTAGGAGTYSFPAGWLKFNVDNRTPAASVSYVNEAWERREDFANNVSDSAAFSTSWYSPAGAADDWMWTPAISVPANAVLKWNSITYDPSYPDGYQVRIKTGAAPTQANQATSATLFSIAAENTTWTARQQSLSAYAGQTIYIGFRNNSNDKFLLLVDDVVVEVQVNNNATMFSTNDLSPYTIIPLSQATPLTLSGNITNSGLAALSNVFMRVNVYDGTNTLITTLNSPTTASIGVGGNANFSIAGGFTPTASDIYIFEYIAKHALTDQQPLDDTLYQAIIIDDSVYARDDGNVTGTLGIGGGGGILGQVFNLPVSDQLTSVGFFINNTGGILAGQPGYALIYGFNNNLPTTVLGSTDTITFDTTQGAYYEIPMAGGPLTLAADSFFVGVVETDSNITLGTATNNYYPNVTFVEFPIGQGNWANNEDYGFTSVYVLRANFGIICPAYSTNFNVTDANCGQADGSATVNVSGGGGPFTYLWNTGAITQTISNVAAGNYTVTITDTLGCSTVGSTSIANITTLAIDSVNITDALCNGDNGSVTLVVSGGSPNYNYNWSNGQTTATMSDGAGTYSVTVTDQAGCIVNQGSITISEPSALSASATSTDETSAGANDGTATANPTGGTSPYTYAWSNGGTTQTINGLGAGTVTCTITDANGCTTTTSTSVATGVNNAVNNGFEFSLFPNPSTGIFNLSVELPQTGTLQINIVDLAGKVVYTAEVENVLTHNREINLSELPSGSYLLKVASGDLTKVRRITLSK